MSSSTKSSSFGQHRLPRLLIATLTTALLLLVPTLLLASPTTDDPATREFTFLSDYGGWANDVILQPDGKIVVAGWEGTPNSRGYDGTLGFLVSRFNVDGTLDSDFGENGTAIIHFAAQDDVSSAQALALQADGKLVAAGSTQCNFWSCPTPYKHVALARFNPDGSLDVSFGEDGRVTTTLGLADGGANALAFQPDGKIVVAGFSYTNLGSPGTAFALVRFNPDGTPDSTFDEDGVVVTDISGYDGANALVVQADGKLVAAGASSSSVALVRYQPNGTLDTTFGEEGQVILTLPNGSLSARGLVLQPDGKLLVAASGGGWEECPRQPDFVLARLTPTGTRDPSFGSNGWVTTDFGGNVAAARDVALMSDGRIVAVGQSTPESDACNPPTFGTASFAVARYLPDGTLDTSFRMNGRHTSKFSTGNQVHTAAAVALQPDGNVVIAGAYSYRLPTADRVHLVTLARISQESPRLYLPLVGHQSTP